MNSFKNIATKEPTNGGSWDFILDAVSIANCLTKTLCTAGDLQPDLLSFVDLIGVKYARIGRVFRLSQDRVRAEYLCKVSPKGFGEHEQMFGNLVNPVLSQIPSGTKVGSIWSLSDIPEQADALSQWSSLSGSMGLNDVVNVILDRTDDSMDVLELYLEQPVANISDANSNAFIRACKIFEAAWRQRSPGSVKQLISALPELHNLVHLSEAMALSHHNPHGLTRAEFMICRHLLTGASVVAISKRVGIQPNTVRTHLSKVYHKTGTSRQSELILFLISGIGYDNFNQIQAAAVIQ